MFKKSSNKFYIEDIQPPAKPRLTPFIDFEQPTIDEDFLESLQEENEDIDLTKFL